MNRYRVVIAASRKDRRGRPVDATGFVLQDQKTGNYVSGSLTQSLARAQSYARYLEAVDRWEKAGKPSSGRPVAA